MPGNASVAMYYSLISDFVCDVDLSVISSFAIILLGKRELVALISFR